MTENPNLNPNTFWGAHASLGNCLTWLTGYAACNKDAALFAVIETMSTNWHTIRLHGEWDDLPEHNTETKLHVVPDSGGDGNVG